MGGGSNTYDYGFRIYNPSLGKFLSVDPIMSSFPWYTPYQFAGNMPIWAIDLDGLEPVISQEAINNRIGQTILKLADGTDAILANGYYVVSYHFPGGNPNYGQYYYCKVGDNEWKQFYPMSMQDMHFAKIEQRLQLISDALDVLLIGTAATAGTLLTLGTAIELYGTEAVVSWLAEEAVETIFESVTGIPIIVDPLDVIEKAAKKGIYSGSKDGLKKWESSRIAEYLETPGIKSVERIEETKVNKVGDFIIDGKTVEFKALTSDKYNASTAMGHLTNASKKGVDIIDLDIRKPGGTAQDARDLYNRFINSDVGKTFTGEVRIATSDGQITFSK